MDKDVLTNEIKKQWTEKSFKIRRFVDSYKNLQIIKRFVAFELTMSTKEEDYNKAVEIIDRMYMLYS